MERLSSAARWYGRLLLAYPPEYLARFGPELRQNFRDLYRDHVRSGRPEWLFWAGILADLGVSALGQYASLIRSKDEMRQYFSNNASGPALLWGVILMLPAAFFFLTALALQVTAPGLRPVLVPLSIRAFLPFALVALPTVAVALNVVPLLKKAARERLGFGFAKRYFWTIALALVALGWVVFLYGHDTIGCAAQNLPLLHWQAFQHCASAH